MRGDSVLTDLLRRRCDPSARRVLEDYLRESGRWSPMVVRVAMGPIPRGSARADAYTYASAYADADAYTYASADADADAHADTYAYANAYADANAAVIADADVDGYAIADANAYAIADDDRDAFSVRQGGEHMRPGLYLWQQPSGNVVVLRIGWVRQIEGDEYEAGNVVIPLRGEYRTIPSEACAIDGPPKNWTFTRPIPGWCPVLRYHVYSPVPLHPKQWAAVCPRPEGWSDEAQDTIGYWTERAKRAEAEVARLRNELEALKGNRA